MSDQEISRGGKRKRGEGFNMDAWWADRSLPRRSSSASASASWGSASLPRLGWVVLLLWNWLMPDIFGLHRLNYWKAGGLLVLCWILFKGIRLGSDNSSKSADRKRRQQLRGYMTRGPGGIRGCADRCRTLGLGQWRVTAGSAVTVETRVESMNGGFT